MQSRSIGKWSLLTAGMLLVVIMYWLSRTPHRPADQSGTSGESSGAVIQIRDLGSRPVGTTPPAVHEQNATVDPNGHPVRYEATPELLLPLIRNALTEAGGRIDPESDIPLEIGNSLRSVRVIEQLMEDARNQSRSTLDRLVATSQLSPEMLTNIRGATEAALSGVLESLTIDTDVAKERIRFLIRTVPGADVEMALSALEDIPWEIGSPNSD